MRATLTDASTLTADGSASWVAAVVTGDGRFAGGLSNVNEFPTDTEAVTWLQWMAAQRGESLDLVRRKVGDR